MPQQSERVMAGWPFQKIIRRRRQKSDDDKKSASADAASAAWRAATPASRSR